VGNSPPKHESLICFKQNTLALSVATKAGVPYEGKKVLSISHTRRGTNFSGQGKKKELGKSIQQHQDRYVALFSVSKRAHKIYKQPFHRTENWAGRMQTHRSTLGRFRSLAKIATMYIFK